MILVTGGAGFIGSHLVDRLINEGLSVRVIDNESAKENEKFYWNPKAENYNLDISDYEATKKLYDGVDIVYHFAAISRIQPAIADPASTIGTNILGTETVLRCSTEAGVKRFVFASSSSIYGNNPIPNVESQNSDCLTVYSSSKLVGEQLCEIFNKTYGLETLCLRFFNVYGDRQPTAGKYATAVGLFIKQKNLDQPLTIVGDGTQSRSFTHVSDVVEACYLAGNTLVDSSIFGKFYNVGLEKSYSINEISKMISGNTISVPKRSGEAQASLANSYIFKKIFGWTPEVYLEEWLKDNA
jgi:UDP-glucose 4-epimerase